jgi:hypothetical protein
VKYTTLTHLFNDFKLTQPVHIYEKANKTLNWVTSLFQKWLHCWLSQMNCYLWAFVSIGEYFRLPILSSPQNLSNSCKNILAFHLLKFFHDIGVWPQGLTLVRQGSTTWSIPSTLFGFCCYADRVLVEVPSYLSRTSLITDPPTYSLPQKPQHLTL